MSFLNFPETQHIKTLDINETIDCGSVTMPAHSELEHIRVKTFIHGNVGGARLRIKLDILSGSDVYSEWSSISDIEGLTDKWIGWVRFDFNRKPLKISEEYKVYVEVDNYTRDNDVTYIGLGYDDYDPVYGSAQADFRDRPIAVQLFTWEME